MSTHTSKCPHALIIFLLLALADSCKPWWKCLLPSAAAKSPTHAQLSLPSRLPSSSPVRSPAPSPVRSPAPSPVPSPSQVSPLITPHSLSLQHSVAPWPVHAQRNGADDDTFDSETKTLLRQALAPSRTQAQGHTVDDDILDPATKALLQQVHGGTPPSNSGGGVAQLLDGGRRDAEAGLTKQEQREADAMARKMLRSLSHQDMSTPTELIAALQRKIQSGAPPRPTPSPLAAVVKQLSLTGVLPSPAPTATPTPRPTMRPHRLGTATSTVAATTAAIVRFIPALSKAAKSTKAPSQSSSERDEQTALDHLGFRLRKVRTNKRLALSAPKVALSGKQTDPTLMAFVKKLVSVMGHTSAEHGNNAGRHSTTPAPSVDDMAAMATKLLSEVGFQVPTVTTTLPPPPRRQVTSTAAMDRDKINRMLHFSVPMLSASPRQKQQAVLQHLQQLRQQLQERQKQRQRIWRERHALELGTGVNAHESNTGHGINSEGKGASLQTSVSKQKIDLRARLARLRLRLAALKQKQKEQAQSQFPL